MRHRSAKPRSRTRQVINHSENHSTMILDIVLFTQFKLAAHTFSTGVDNFDNIWFYVSSEYSSFVGPKG